MPRAAPGKLVWVFRETNTKTQLNLQGSGQGACLRENGEGARKAEEPADEVAGVILREG